MTETKGNSLPQHQTQLTANTQKYNYFSFLLPPGCIPGGYGLLGAVRLSPSPLPPPGMPIPPPPFILADRLPVFFIRNQVIETQQNEKDGYRF